MRFDRWCHASTLGLAAAVSSQSLVLPQDVERIVDDHCAGCHGKEKPEAGLDLGVVGTRPLADALLTWMSARDKVQARVMPPPGYSELDDAEVARLVTWVNATVDARRAEVTLEATSAGPRRLSRSQYERSIRDLFGVSVAMAAEFPQDDLAFGFDTMGNALSFTTLHVEKYLAAAEAVAAAVIDDVDPQAPPVRRVEAEDLASEQRVGTVQGEFANLYTASELLARWPALPNGSYTLRVRAYGDQAGDEAPLLAIDVDGVRLLAVPIEAVRRAPSQHECEVELAGGDHAVGLAFVNNHYDPEHPDPTRRDRNLHLDWLELIGPRQTRPVPAGSRWWFGRDLGAGAAAAARLRAMLSPLLERAWRAAVTEDGLRPILGVAEASLARGESWPRALRLAVTAILLSPRFVLRGEVSLAADVLPAATRAFELAARLSFFLWGSVPDAALLARARDGSLLQPDVIVAEVQRMLADARASALATDFAGQWLELRQLATASFDGARFPSVSSALLHDMRRETELLFEAFLRERRPVRDLLIADFTFLNQRLAAHYGIEGAFDGELSRVPIAAPERHGLLAHASILALTSNPTRTSPVKRGKWILDNLLDAPPPAPPPGSDNFAEGAIVDHAASLRAQMAMHRSAESCALCHVRMDGLGLALERFDAVGRPRDGDAGGPIDDTGWLPGGRKVQGLGGLRAVLLRDLAFVRCVAHKLFLYGVGRPPHPAERVWLDAELRARSPGGVTLPDLIALITRMPAFVGV